MFKMIKFLKQSFKGVVYLLLAASLSACDCPSWLSPICGGDSPPPPSPPVPKVAQADSLMVETTLDNAVEVTLSGRIGESGDLLSFELLDQPSDGVLSGVAPTLLYAPNSGFRGSDQFQYRVNDGATDSSAATVTINIVNQAPTATTQMLQSSRNNAVDVVLSGSDPENDPLSYVIAEPPVNGTLSGTPPNVRYAPNSGFAGRDQFRFSVSDGEKSSTTELISIEVTNQPPVATTQALIATVDSPLAITLTGSDPDGDPLTYSLIGQAGRGVLSGQAPNLIYTPELGYIGGDKFAFKVSDGIEISAPMVVDIDVHCAVPSLTGAYDYFNRQRQLAGMIVAGRSLIIEKAAQNHADYQLLNTLYGHTEDPAKAGFTGIHPSDRGVAAGYNYRWISENVAGSSTPQKAIDVLMTAIYHRFGILDFYKDEVGLGLAIKPNQCLHSFVNNNGNGQLNDLCSVDTYVSGGWYTVCVDPNRRVPTASYLAAKQAPAIQNPNYVVWPADGMVGISPIFYEESPDPLPDYSESGNPLSIQFNPEIYLNGVTLISFQMFDATGVELTNTRFLDQASDPNGYFDAYQFALYSLDVLADNANYRAKVVFTADGVQQVVTWSFTTGAR